MHQVSEFRVLCDHLINQRDRLGGLDKAWDTGSANAIFQKCLFQMKQNYKTSPSPDLISTQIFQILIPNKCNIYPIVSIYILDIYVLSRRLFVRKISIGITPLKMQLSFFV